MNINKKAVCFSKGIEKHGVLFNYNIRADTLLVIGYDAFR